MAADPLAARGESRSSDADVRVVVSGEQDSREC